MNLITITRPAYEQLIQACLDQFPNEACGVLACFAQDHEYETISEVLAIRNAAGMPVNSYKFDPSDWVTAMYKIKRNRLTIAGFFHSHPASPAVPSASDVQQWTGGMQICSWIVSLTQPDAPVVRTYRPVVSSAGALMFTEVSIHIV
ncbi:hypothetical protein DNH61_11045 [Paenibacillus sambharensis]|uniref:JAB domain-containing protein n=1 Tax=Paenibacillus sambharensis TaxID=1803190 RepID=A0A2W1LLW9_9BACL|nr:M67 family metallopeptidase [Paenibacillus sambharensis]PZD95962.1 hypothetical protein DNH61_11045 [Paenibacillus sambharensis]